MGTPDERAIHAGDGGDSAPQPPPRTASERLAAALPRSVLTLETIDPEPVGVTVNGTWHAMRFYEDFSLTEHARFARLKRQADELAALAEESGAEDLSDEEADALNAAIDAGYGGMVRLILPTLPPYLTEVQAEGDPRRPLSLVERQAIVTAFLSQQAERAARIASARLARATTATGGGSSPRSAPATATGGTGGRKRRSRTSSPPTATSPA